MHRLLIPLAVTLDAITTTLGLALGFAENGPVASRLLPALGPLYFPLELLVVYTLYGLVVRYTLLRGDWAMLASVVGPWVAGWSNLGVSLRSMGVVA